MSRESCGINISKSSSGCSRFKGIARICVCINIAGLNVMTFILRVGLQEVCVVGQWTIECGGEDQ